LDVSAATARSSDEALVRRILRGHRDDFETLVRRHERPIANFIYRMVGDPETALDLSQEVFTRVFLNLRQFDPTFRFTTWLYRIASNLAIDHLRRRRTPSVSLDRHAPGDTSGSHPVFEPAAADPAPDEILASREMARRVVGAIDRLPEPYRRLMRLRHQRHLSYLEIARATQLPLGTVKNRMFRARAILRETLGGDA
jgi:RNA polymerase sigma-70 factor (ECF subfamily)